MRTFRAYHVNRSVTTWLAAGAILLALARQQPPLLAQASIRGQWRTLPDLMPINPVHLALTNDGKVLVIAGSGNDPAETTFRAVVWDPVGATFVPHILGWDMFCNGMSMLADGRVFINGGNLRYHPFLGLPRSAYTTRPAARSAIWRTWPMDAGIRRLRRSATAAS